MTSGLTIFRAGDGRCFCALEVVSSLTISKLNSLDDASRAEKQLFVTYYDLTRKETFPPRLLRVGMYRRI